MLSEKEANVHAGAAQASNTNSETLVGRLTEINGDGFVGKLISRGGEFISERMVGMHKVRVGQVGSYLKVVQHGHDVIVMVEGTWQQRDHDGRVEHMIRLSPMGEMEIGGEFRRGVSNFPTTGAELHAMSSMQLERIFSDTAEGGYKVGKLSASKTTDVYFNASKFFGRHAAILGQSGAGKSWTVTSFIQNALRTMPSAHIVIMDMHAEYGDKEMGVKARSPFPENKVRCLDARDLEVPYWLLSFAELCELFIDDDDPNAAVQQALLRSSLIDLKRETNADADLGQITVDAPVYFPMMDLFQRIKDANKRSSDFGKTKSATFGKFDQLLVRMESLLNDNRYDFLLRPKLRTSTESLVGLMEDFVGLGGDQTASVTVLDLSAVPIDVAPMVTAQIARLAFEFNFWNPKCREFPITLVCEEAHEYIPRGSHPRYKQAKRMMERIAKVGRKYGVSMLVVSQRPHDVSETVLAQCGTYVCLRTTNPNDQEYMRAMVPDSAQGVLASITSLGPGEVIAMGEGVPIPVRFQVNRPSPPPNAADIDFTKSWRHGGVDIDVKKLVRRWHKQIR
ncbi:MAG: ATP-binding protein [Xanthomonadales bacterium]|nr:ATP-binding protein [Xanthomonadales bacterium]